MPDTSHLAIQTTGLSKSFGEIQALRNLDLKVPKNSIFGFLGPNGAGKTTAMKLLLGLSHPTAGSGRVLDMDIVRDSVAIRQRIGYLAQDPRFYEHMSARETLRFTAGENGVPDLASGVYILRAAAASGDEQLRRLVILH